MLALFLADGPIALWTLIVTMIGVAISIVAAISALYAALYARRTPTKEDLDRVRTNAASTSEDLANLHSQLAVMKEDVNRVERIAAGISERLENVDSHFAAMNRRLDTQQERDALMARVNGVSLKFKGDVEPGKDGQFTIAIQDENVVLKKVELYNGSENKFGSALCEDWNPPLQMLVRLDGATFMKWYEAGSLTSDNPNLDRILHLRVYMKLKGVAEEVCRSMTVTTKILMPQQVVQGMTPLKYRLYGEV
ncbi:MAG TPA: hypothetical protein VG267_22900 [Terracidiphilus sp.]|jgi:hypothetical protein|nr:hypothetical protein [Terracidiphilus sp.]